MKAVFPLLFAALLTPLAVSASETLHETTLVIQNHKFSPEELRVPANTRIKLVVHNKDASAEEFESHELRREKIIAGNSKGTVFISPLAAGSYPFVGEFHEDSAKGVIIAE